MEPIADTFDAAFSKTVDLANKMADKDKDADLWDIADGLLAGAIQYWLYSRQPCGDTRCQDCMPISTAEGRMSELKRLIEQLASESEYFHTPTDSNAGRREKGTIEIGTDLFLSGAWTSRLRVAVRLQIRNVPVPFHALDDRASIPDGRSCAWTCGHARRTRDHSRRDSL